MNVTVLPGLNWPNFHLRSCGQHGGRPELTQSTDQKHVQVTRRDGTCTDVSAHIGSLLGENDRGVPVQIYGAQRIAVVEDVARV